jgi:hypothetical protein
MPTATCTACGKSYEAESQEPGCEPRCPKCRAPYPWCTGAPTVADCVKAGFCKRDPSCGE